jgi:pimeloyl-ACP methyl ester carboxylesterase
MIAFHEKSLLGLASRGFYRCRYYEWGRESNPDVVICVHGLTRNGRDFDALARALASQRRVICPDMPGRGKSDWLGLAADYRSEVYVSLLTALIARSNAERVSWVGTSMGGLLGMGLASQPGTPIERMVINDVGPQIEPEALQRIASYVGLDPPFDTFSELEAHIRNVSASFGPLSNEQWRHLAQTTARQLPDGRFRLAYDPAIAEPFKAMLGQKFELWPMWDAIKAPVLLLRGADSDLLTRGTAEAMCRRGPRVEFREFSGVGHAPMLLDREQIAPVVEFLLRE